MPNEYYIYILTNEKNTVLYTGVTNDLFRRIDEHRDGSGGVFTRRYGLKKLVYYEQTESIDTAISREKQIKAGSRQKKIDLIQSLNPDWADLAEELF